MKQNSLTGNNDEFLKQIRKSIAKAERIDIIVSFLMESGVKLILDDLKNTDAKIRILTSRYLNITQPEALIVLKSEVGKNLDLRFYNQTNKSFHPKAYIFHNREDSETYVGSSNLSRGALTTSIEWNYHFTKNDNPDDFNAFQENFEDLFENHSIEITDEVLKSYSKSWKKPKEEYEIIPKGKTFEPNPAQTEALYELSKTREEGFDKALVVAATGTGKTYLAVFDSKNYNKIIRKCSNWKNRKFS